MADAAAETAAEPSPEEPVSVPIRIATIESKLARDTTARRNAVPDIVRHAMSSPRYTETTAEAETEVEQRPPSPIRTAVVSAPAPPVARAVSRRKIGMVML
jgi:hypothetical protein